MTVQQSDLYTGEARAWADDEIDLRRYLMVIVAWWREIVLITLIFTLLAVIAAWLWQSRQPTVYAASADIVMARITSRIALDQRITTSEETQQGGVASWRASLIQLAQSPAIAQTVLAELDGQMSDSWTPQELSGRVTVANPPGPDPRTLSDIIRITVSTGDPAQSALIANTWANHFVDHVNRLYGQVPEDTLTAVQAELETTRADYLEAEAALEAYIAESQAEGLQRQIDEVLALRKQVQAGRDSLLAATAISTNQVISSTIQANLDHLTQLYDQRRLTQVQLSQARNLATQLEQSDPAASASNALALQLLKTQVFARPLTQADQPLTMDLNLDLPPLTADASALTADARILVAILEGYLVQLDAEIATTSDMLSNQSELAFLERIRTGQETAADPVVSTSPDLIQRTLVQLDQDLQELQSRLAADQARQRQLTQQRDLTWTAYEALSNKLVELNLTRTSTNSEVRIGAAAVAPVEPEPRSSLMIPIAAVAVASLVFALFLALVSNAIGHKPLLTRT